MPSDVNWLKSLRGCFKHCQNTIKERSEYLKVKYKEDKVKAKLESLGFSKNKGTRNVNIYLSEEDEEERIERDDVVLEMRALEKEATAFAADLLFFLDKFVRKFDDKEHAK